MTISKKVVKARLSHGCSRCGETIKPGDLYVRLFGSSDDRLKNPPPFVVRECLQCRYYYNGESLENGRLVR